MYIKDKQKLVSKELFRRLQISLKNKDLYSYYPVDVLAGEVLEKFKDHEEIKPLSKEEKEELQTYLQIGFSEPI